MTTATTTTEYCTFWADGLYFGIAVSGVQEVLRFQEMTPVPRAPEAVDGLINLRGQIVTAIDLRHRLGLTPRAEGELPMNVIVRSRNDVVSLLVDDIGDVIDTAGSHTEPVPPTLPPTVREAVTGVVSLPASRDSAKSTPTTLLVLDADRAADVPQAHRTPGGNQ